MASAAQARFYAALFDCDRAGLMASAARAQFYAALFSVTIRFVIARAHCRGEQAILMSVLVPQAR